jgi:hypothetical protein
MDNTEMIIILIFCASPGFAGDNHMLFLTTPDGTAVGWPGKGRTAASSPLQCYQYDQQLDIKGY